ncbi:leucine--tRNA ligase [bacterium]|nr:leucine--tRNA ligase [bacterium]
MEKYDFKKIEKKWQKFWEEKEIFKAKDFSKSPKFYILDMFPYPSGAGLHVGHPRGYIATDVIAHYMRMKGYNVLHPMGWDAFGLPAENYAIKTGIHPRISTKQNIAQFKEQMKMIGLSYDWSREINTTDPEYYKWTQWIFLKFFRAGLVYNKTLPINWCPSCKTGLANEEVVGGKCERCGTEVTKKEIPQWVLKITAYAEKLLEGLDKLDWPEKIKEMQKNWIGRSEGAMIKFQISNFKFQIEVFTTRADTIFGATFLVLAPEHPLVLEITTPEYREEVKKYIEETKKKLDVERQEEKEKTGVFTGAYAINPATEEKIPIWVSDYVLPYYGTGAIMAVPAHDQRDFEFARKYDLPIIEVISQNSRLKTQNHNSKLKTKLEKAYEGEGVLVNSGQFDRMPSQKAREEIVKWLKLKGLAEFAVNYKLRDWIFSRQRYWGEPIPLVFCEECKKRIQNSKFPPVGRAGKIKNLEKNQIYKIQNYEYSLGEILNPGWIAVPEEELPLTLPKVEKYQPTGTGESPLAGIKDWVETKCPKCGAPAKRETNTMPQWAGSCWYFIRYVDPKNNKALADRKLMEYWLPVDFYVGGAEHAVLHLLYARFWTKFLYDQEILPFNEPFLKLRNQGLILAPDGRKMSKSKGNVINPDDLIKEYGADAFRLYEMFMGPFDQPISWDPKGILGTKRFLEKVFQIVNSIHWGVASDSKLQIGGSENNKETENRLKRKLHQTIKKVTEDIEAMKFNTAIASMMEFVNELQNSNCKLQIEDFKKFLIILAPFAPHFAEELYHQIEKTEKSIFEEKWPEYDETLIEKEIITLIVQINGKVRDQIQVKKGISEEEAKELALKLEKIQKWLKGRKIKKVIFVKDRLINFVVR